jgi:hypothetical protein
VKSRDRDLLLDFIDTTMHIETDDELNETDFNDRKAYIRGLKLHARAA